MNCSSCGHPSPAGNRFCGSCGAELDHAGTLSAAAAAPAPSPAMAASPHPAAAGWSPAPPPARRRAGPALLAALMGLLLLFGGVGLFAARSVTARAGAGSPEAAASGLLGALDKQDLERAAGYLDGEERQAVTVYA
ncbi:MAG TPA: zinc ribbon domain-containing protein, partial [Actinomycetota bacterium]|nr:zinc ribbon domain-containing protein [Actinomycetota bacterium]